MHPITRRRLELHLSASRLAVLSDVSLRTILRAERGEQLNALSYWKIAEALGYPNPETFIQEMHSEASDSERLQPLAVKLVQPALEMDDAYSEGPLRETM